MKKNLFIVLLVALFFRLPLLGGSFWLDEAAQALESSRSLGEQHLIAGDFQPPLLHYIVHFMLLVGRDEVWLRSISLMSGLVTIAFLYLILKQTAGEKAAMIAGLLLAINPFHIFFSQELRPYSLAAMFACLSWWALLKEKRAWFVVATIGGLYSMYLYPFISFSQLIYVAFERRKQLRSQVILLLISYLCFLPWLPFFLDQLRVGTGLTQLLPGWSEVVGTSQFKALPLILTKFILGQIDLKDSFLFYALAIPAIGIVIFATWSVWKGGKYRFLVYWFALTILSAWIISFLVPVIAPKRVMIALPAMTGILGVWLAERKKLMTGLFVGVSLAAFLIYLAVPKYQRENWRGLIQTIERDTVNRKSAAVFAFPEPFAPWRWYSQGKIASFSTQTLLVKSETELFQPFFSLGSYDRIYLFDYLSDLSDPKGLSKQWLRNNGFVEIRAFDGGNVGFVRVYDSL